MIHLHLSLVKLGSAVACKTFIPRGTIPGLSSNSLYRYENYYYY